MNAEECAVEFMNKRHTRDQITLLQLSVRESVNRKDIAREYRRLLK